MQISWSQEDICGISIDLRRSEKTESTLLIGRALTRQPKKQCTQNKPVKLKKKVFQIVHIVPLDTMLTKLKFGNWKKWMLTTFLLGARAEQLQQKIAKCCVKPITELRGINKF